MQHVNFQSSRNEPKDFSSGEYRICAIEVEDGRGNVTSLYRVREPHRTEPTILNFGEPFRIRVQYECLLPQVPELSCGVACALTLVETMEHAMYFNTNHPHSDEELRHYYDADFRKVRGRTGVVEGLIHKLQVRPSNYLLTVGILPNQTGSHEFYELHYLRYAITVQSNAPEFPALFYPNVRFTHDTLDHFVTPVTSEMIRAGKEAIAGRLPPGIVLDEQLLSDVYAAMCRARPSSSGQESQVSSLRKKGSTA
jgi:hypothetical protein